MSLITIALLSILALFICVILGVHISFSLAAMSVLGIIFMSSGNLDRGFYILATTTYEALRTYTFTVIPLFMIMGSLMSNSDIAKNLFAFLSRILRKIPGGLAVATVIANAFFAAVTGVSIASAAIFSRVAVPEMTKAYYKARFSIGTVAGSSTLGMLIPPSLTLILYGTLAEVSIGKIFIAGVIPGVILAVFFAIYVSAKAILTPGSVFVGGYSNKEVSAMLDKRAGERSTVKLFFSVLPVLALIGLVFGGIWGGLFSPTEAAAVGALGALIIGWVCGMGFRGLKAAVLETARNCGGILFLLMTAQMYSRMLTMSGLVNWLNGKVAQMDVSPWVIFAIFMAIILFLGCLLDSSSILLITVPLMAPIMLGLGFDMIWFGIVLLLFVHIGLITPPFGICVFAIKASLPDDTAVTLEEIFVSGLPFIAVLFLHALLMIFVPSLVTYLPSIGTV